jgi:hypothetical protein
VTTPPVPDPSDRRPTFREGQLLDAPAMQAEQQARSAALTRHETLVHTAGEGALRAAAVTHPDGGSRVVLGGDGLLSVQFADGKGGFRDAAAVQADGTRDAAGATTVTGPAAATGPAVLSPPIPAPPAAAPWSLYRAAVSAPGNPAPSQPGTEQLRLEVGAVPAGADPTAVQALVINGGDVPATLLRVDANGSVTIPGQLYVTGNITVVGGGAAAANTDLTAASEGVSSQQGQVSYILRLATTAATSVTSITVYQTVVSGGTASRTTLAQGVSLQAAASTTFTQDLPAGHVTVDVLAIGVGQDGRPRSATLSFST